MAELVLTVDVDAPVAATWEAATDWTGQREWMLGTDVTQLGQGAGDGGVGVKLAARTGFGPVGFVDTMEITAWAPPYRCEVLHTGRVVRGTGAFEVQELSGGRSRFVWSEWLDLPFGVVGEWGWRLARPVSAAAIGFSLRRFAAWVPTRPRNAAGAPS